MEEVKIEKDKILSDAMLFMKMLKRSRGIYSSEKKMKLKI